MAAAALSRRQATQVSLKWFFQLIIDNKDLLDRILCMTCNSRKGNDHAHAVGRCAPDQSPAPGHLNLNLNLFIYWNHFSSGVARFPTVAKIASWRTVPGTAPSVASVSKTCFDQNQCLRERHFHQHVCCWESRYSFTGISLKDFLCFSASTTILKVAWCVRQFYGYQFRRRVLTDKKINTFQSPSLENLVYSSSMIFISMLWNIDHSCGILIKERITPNLQ